MFSHFPLENVNGINHILMQLKLNSGKYGPPQDTFQTSLGRINIEALLKEGILGGNLVLCTGTPLTSVDTCWTRVQQGLFGTSLPLMSLQ